MAGKGTFTRLAICLAFLAGCAEQGQQQTHTLQSCEDVRAQGSFELLLRPGDAVPGVVLTGPDAQLQAAAIEQSPSGLLLNIPGNEVAAILTCPELKALELLGAVRASAADGQPITASKLAAYGSSALQLSSVQADELDIRSSGQASIEVGSVLAESLHLQSSSDSRLRLAGETGRLYMALRGNAQVDAGELRAQWVEVSALDNSVVRAHASAHLGGQVAATASLDYTGTPDLDLHTPVD